MSTNQEWRRKNIERSRQNERSWAKRNRKRIKAKDERYKKSHPGRYAAAMRVYRAIKKGVLVRPSFCSRCGVLCRPEAHHADYSKPLDVVWLCKPCHCKESVQS